MTYKIQGEAPFQVLATNFSLGPSNEGYTLQISADGVNYSNLFSVGANVTRMVTGVANGSYYRLNGNNSIVSVNWQRQCDNGGGGGSSDYATSAGTAETAIISNSTRLLDGVIDFPQDANNGDVVAIGEDQRKGAKSGTKRPLPSTGIYQYDGSSWNKIETETPDFTSLMPVSSFPENPVAGEVVAIVEQPEVVESVNPTRGGAKSPVQPEEVSIYQYDGVNWNKVGGGDNTILEHSDEMPSNMERGDVYAIHIDAEDAIIEDDWVDSGEQNITYDRQGDGNPQAISIKVTEGDTLALGYAVRPWNDVLYLTVGDGELECDDEYRFGGNHTNELRLIDPMWMNQTNGKAVIAWLEDGKLYFYTEDASVIWIYSVDGNETGNSIREGTVTPAHPDINDVYQFVNYDEDDDTPITDKLAKESEIPGDDKLLPYWNIDTHSDTILGIDYWAGGPTWQDKTSVVNTALRNFDGYAEGKILKAIDTWNMKWVELEKHNKIESVEELPERTKDGNVFAYASGGSYGIYQAQSGTPAQGWEEGTTEISGYTQIRVPYTASDTTYLEFGFEGYSDLHNLWWHYDEGNDPHWDGNNVPIDEQVDGEFSGVDGDGVSISCVRDGDYLVVTFGEAVKSVAEIENTEIYDEYVAPNYVEMATMDYVNNTLGNIETILQSI